MNKQEIFDRVATHLLTQGEKSMRVRVEDGLFNKSCLYRGPGDLKCAVGVLIKDEHFSPSWNHMDITKPEVRTAVQKSLGVELDESDWGFLLTLQTVHDSPPVDEWRQELRCVAALHQLDPKVLDQ